MLHACQSCAFLSSILARSLAWAGRVRRRSQMPRAYRLVAIYSAGLGGAIASALPAQQLATPTATAVTGTYALGTDHSFSPGVDACWLEVAPVAPDSVRLQLLCRHPGPGHHLGVLDVRRRFDAGKVVYETDEFVGHCRIAVSFTRNGAVVTHEASGASRDSACGFGAYIDVSGTYRRLSARQPRFDLGPIERQPGPRRG
jgi:hypothetical protein